MNKMMIMVLVAALCLSPVYAAVTRSVSGSTITYSSTMSTSYSKAYWSVYEGISGCAVTSASCSPSTNVACTYQGGALKVVANTQESGGSMPATVTVSVQGSGTCSLSGQWVESYNTGTQAVVMSTPNTFSAATMSLSSTSYSCTGTTPSNSQICSGDDQSLTANVAKTLVDSCGSAKCEYTCATGYYKSGSSCVAQTYTCTNMPAHSSVCTGDDAGLTSNTASTLVDTCGSAKCEFTCSAGYSKSGSECVAIQSCTDAGGYCCPSGNTCSSPKTNTQGCSGTCCDSASFCAAPSQTCAQLSGTICTTDQICSGGAFTTSTDSAKCCLSGTCQVQVKETTCPLECEFYESCNDTQTACKVATWVYIVGGFMAFMMFWSMMRR